jgi:enterochelin esterase-like enzyme
VTIALTVALISVWMRLQAGGQLPMLRFLADGFSGRALVNGHPGVLLSSTLLTRDLFMLTSMSISLIVTLGTFEVVAGSLRATALAIGGAVLGPVAVTAGLGGLSALGASWAAKSLSTVDIGASAVVAAASGAVAGRVRDRRLTIGLLLFLLGGLIVHHRLADWEHLLVFGPGYLFGRCPLQRHRSRRQDDRRSDGAPRSLWTRHIAAVTLSAVALAGCQRVLPDAPVYRGAGGQILSAPRLVDVSYPTPSTGGSRHVLALLPAGYDNTTGRYPVIELLHGEPGNPSQFLSLGDVAASAQAHGVTPFIAVMPDGHATHPYDSWYTNTAGQAVGTAVSTDLRAWVSTQFRTTTDWSYAGLSSGGFAAAYLPLIDPAPVHGVCGLSGYYDAHIPALAHASPATRAAASAIQHPAREPALTLLTYGRSDTRSAASALSYAAALRRVHHTVVLRGYPGGHQWVAWRPALLACFRLLAPAR